MYSHDTYKQLLPAISLSIVIVFSLMVNVKQFFDLQYYKAVATETQQFLQNAVPNLALATSKISRTVAVNLTDAKCLSESIYYEAANQSLIGKIAVGQVVLNRTKKPNYPKSVCGVVNQRTGDVCQFSWACHDKKEIANSPAWQQSQQVAYDLLSRDPKSVVDITEGATHFHTLSVRPNWKGLKPTAKIDDHQFYRQ